MSDSESSGSDLEIEVSRKSLPKKVTLPEESKNPTGVKKALVALAEKRKAKAKIDKEEGKKEKAAKALVKHIEEAKQEPEKATNQSIDVEAIKREAREEAYRQLLLEKEQATKPKKSKKKVIVEESSSEDEESSSEEEVVIKKVKKTKSKSTPAPPAPPAPAPTLTGSALLDSIFFNKGY